MSLPDNADLKALIDAATPGPWQIHEEHDPSCASKRSQKCNCNCEGVIEIIGLVKTPNTYDIVAIGELSSSDVGNLRLLVHGRDLAAEVIRLRGLLAELSTAAKAHVDAAEQVTPNKQLLPWEKDGSFTVRRGPSGAIVLTAYPYGYTYHVDGCRYVRTRDTSAVEEVMGFADAEAKADGWQLVNE